MCDNNVLVLTPSMFLNILCHGFISLPQVNLLILDECELAVKDHPYAQIMTELKSISSDEAPRILGLTESILHSKCKTPAELQNSISDLESTLHCKAETASDSLVIDLLDCRPTEELVECADYHDETGLVVEVQGYLDPVLAFLDDCNLTVEEGGKDPKALPRTVIQEVKAVLLSLGLWSASKVADIISRQIAKLADQEPCERARRFLHLVLTQLLMIHKIVDDHFDKEVQCVEDFMKYVSPKAQKLIDILCQHKPDDSFVIIGGDDFMDSAEISDDSFDSSDDEDFREVSVSDKSKQQKSQVHYVAVKKPEADGQQVSPASSFVKDEGLCGLVFVERRHTAFALNKLVQELCNWIPDLYFIKSSQITGHSSRSSSNNKETDNKKQEEVLRKFRQGEANLLIATSGSQDRLDIPKCNAVLCFDAPDDYSAYIHSKGRARSTDSKYYMLVNAEDLEKVNENISKFKGIEKILMNKSSEQKEPPEVIDSNEADAYLPPYKPALKSSSSCQTPSQVTMSTAISLVNKYCAKLPSDAFTHLTPKCTVKRVTSAGSTQYMSSLQLPINSPIKEPIQGVPMPSKKLAQMAVALKTCEILHKHGELDDNLLPVGKEVIKYADNGEWENEESMGQARPGTTKRKQCYEKRVSPAFIGQPKADKRCFLYLCDMHLKNPITEEQNPRGRKIHAPEETKRCFGILTDGEIPKVPLFPVFTRSGEVTVSLVLLSSDMTLNEDQIGRLSSFHQYIFAKVLRLEKYPVVYEPDNAKCSYIVLPLSKEHDEVVIDWSFVELIQEAAKHDPRALAKQRKKELFIFKEDVFQDAVVMPSYRNTDQYFYVAEIRYDLSPQSEFPSPELYDTFYDYYHGKYGLHLTSKKQPLLDVDHTSARLNLLTPRYMNQKGIALPTSSAETRRARRENLQQKQILVPELCLVHPFPASLWRKAVCIPAILYRINCLLIAEEIRKMIAREAHIGVVEVPKDFSFPELDFGFSTKPSDALLAANGLTPDNADQSSTEKETSNSSSDRCACDCRMCSSVRQKGSEAHLDPDDSTEHSDSVPETMKLTDDIEAIQKTPAQIRDGETRDSHAVLDESTVKVQTDSSEIDRRNSEEEIEARNEELHDTCTESAEKTDDGSAKSDHVSARSDDVSAKSDDVSTKSDDVSTKSDDVGAKSDDVSTKSDDLSTKSDDGGAKSNDVSAKSDDLSTKSDDVSSKSYDLSTKSDDVGARSDDLSTKSDDVSARSDDVSAKSDDVSAKSDDVSTDLNRHKISDVTTDNTHSDDISTATASQSDDRSLKHDSYIYNENPPSDFEDLQHHMPDKKISPVHKGATDLTDENQCVIAVTEKFRETNMNSSMDFEEGSGQDISLEAENNDEKVKRDGSSNAAQNEEVDTVCTCLQNCKDVFESMDDDMDHLDFDKEEDLNTFIGPSPCTILQTLTMSNANDFFNLERSETIGDSFLKFAITVYLYCTYPGVHEGKLSYLRSKQVSNYNLYHLGKKKGFAERMVAAKFEPTENWLPPRYVVKPYECAMWNDVTNGSVVQEKKDNVAKENGNNDENMETNTPSGGEQETGDITKEMTGSASAESVKELIPYYLQTQQSLPDKSIADCVEALIGCYLTTCGQRAALLFMSWLGLKVLPPREQLAGEEVTNQGKSGKRFMDLPAPHSPLLKHVPDAQAILINQLDGFETFEKEIRYTFRDKAYLLQAFTHASYHYNSVTDCYQRLEFLGDAVLDYVITRHLFEDKRKHSPGILTDLRSALVNNNIFAALAVKWNFHKYFKAVSPQLFKVIEKFVAWKKDKPDDINFEEFLEESDENEGEDIEIPKALGDIFESVAGAIYLDSGMSLNQVWAVYYRMMKPQIEQYTMKIPKSPVRELLELEPETAKFEKPERTLDGKIRVTVRVVGKGRYCGVGRNYRIAKSAAAKRALKGIYAFQQRIQEQRQSFLPKAYVTQELM